MKNKKILRIDSIGGVSGDMILAMLLGLGAPLNTIIESLNKLNIGEFNIRLEEVYVKGFKALRLIPSLPDMRKALNFTEMKNILNQLEEPVRKLSIKILTNLAIAEAKVHNCNIEDVHFHEIGDYDTILDIAGTCIAINSLEISQVISSPLPIGKGVITTAHGMLPSPAPATMELIKDFEVYFTDEESELVTPTGASLITTLSKEMPFKSRFSTLRLHSISFATGTKEFKTIPNLIRGSIFTEKSFTDYEYIVELKCNLDDINPEIIGAVSVKLLNSGALDVYTTAVNMKKQRPGILLTVLTKYEDMEKLIKIIFEETSTFGIRIQEYRRVTLSRETTYITTKYGNIRVKIGLLDGKAITFSPEHDDCLKAAVCSNVPLKNIYEAVIAECEKLKTKYN